MTKLSFDDVMELVAEERRVDICDVSAKALNRVVWVAEWHVPGCMPESFQYCTSKKNAIESALFMANDEEHGHKGMKTNLRKYGRHDTKTEMFGTVVNTVYKLRLRDIL